MSISLCNRCYVFEKSATCVTSGEIITVYMPIHNQVYTFWITDKFGNYWLITDNSWGDFHLDLNLSYLPEGMANEFSGTYEVTISESMNENQPVSFTVDSIEYDCFIIKFVKTSSL